MIDKINNDIVVAMKSADKFRLSVLRMLKSALQLEEINKKSTLTDDEVYNVIKKQVKQRNDSKEEFEKYNQQDKVETLNQEIEILKAYLPEELSDEVLDQIIDESFKALNPSSMKEMGLIMKDLNNRLEGKFVDKAKVSSKVRERLQ